MAEDTRADATEGDTDPFAALEKDIPSESPAEKEPEKDKPAEGANTPPQDTVPFHKHPRWIEREKELVTIKEHEAKIAAELEQLKAQRTPSNPSIPDWFKELYGDNSVAWEKYSLRETQLLQEVEQKVLDRQQQAVQAQQAETAHWSKWVDDEIARLESEGKAFDRNKLIKTMLEYRPTDEENNFDFNKGYEIYKALEGTPDTAKSQARKQLADTASASSKGEPKAKDYLTTNDLRHRSWSNL